MSPPDHLDADFARDPETAYECVQIAPMGGDLCAILFMLSDRDYERTLSLVFTARGFAPDSVERILKTEEWLMSLTCPARDELFALEATTRIWHYRNRFWKRDKVTDQSMRRVWGGDGTQPLLVGRGGLALRNPAGAWLPIPPASAISHSPDKRLWQARCTATSEVEQAVCTLMLGPRRSKAKEARVARKSLSLPVCRSRNRPT